LVESPGSAKLLSPFVLEIDKFDVIQYNQPLVPEDHLTQKIHFQMECLLLCKLTQQAIGISKVKFEANMKVTYKLKLLT